MTNVNEFQFKHIPVSRRISDQCLWKKNKNTFALSVKKTKPKNLPVRSGCGPQPVWKFISGNPVTTDWTPCTKVNISAFSDHKLALVLDHVNILRMIWMDNLISYNMILILASKWLKTKFWFLFSSQIVPTWSTDDEDEQTQ